MSFSEFLTVLKTYGGWAILLLLIWKPDILKSIRAAVLAVVAFFGLARKQYVGTTIEKKLSYGCEMLNSAVGTEFLDASDVKIKWVKNTDRESFIKDGKIVVKLSYSDNPNRNFVNTVVSFLGQAFLPNAKHYISEEIIKSSELLIAKKIIEKEMTVAIDCFLEEVYNPVVRENPTVAENIKTFNVLDDKGYFLQVFLPELRIFGNRACANGLPTEECFSKSKQLLDHVVTVANKELGEEVDVELPEEGGAFGFTIVLLKTETIKQKGIFPYLYYIESVIKRGFNRVYVFGAGDLMKKAEVIVRQIGYTYEISTEKKNTTVRLAPSGRKRKGVCYVINATGKSYTEDLELYESIS